LFLVDPLRYGLLLEPTALKKGQYKRLGIFELRGYDQSSIAASCCIHDKMEWSYDQESGDIDSEAWIIEIV
jgi:hypothetical protein